MTAISSLTLANTQFDHIQITNSLVADHNKLTEANNSFVSNSTITLLGSGTTLWVNGAATIGTINANSIISSPVIATNQIIDSGIDLLVYANTIYAAANSYSGFSNTITATANTVAQSAYNQANTANTIAQAAYNAANVANSPGGFDYLWANAAFNQANASWLQANTANNVAQTSFNQANSAFSSANTASNTRVAKTGDSMSGPLVMYAGNNAAPSIVFSGNTNTGFYLANTSNVSVSANTIAMIWFDGNQSNVAAGNTGKITFNANVTSPFEIASTSDIAFKKDVVSINDALDTVDKLRPVEYTMTIGSGTKKAGFIAQELQEILPHIVFGPDGGKAIGYLNLIAYLCAGIQELHEKVKKLEEQLNVG